MGHPVDSGFQVGMCSRKTCMKDEGVLRTDRQLKKTKSLKSRESQRMMKETLKMNIEPSTTDTIMLRM